MVSYNNTEDLNNDQGFVVKPVARKKLIRKPDGSLQVVYVDMRTGKPVNPSGYTVIQSDNNVSELNITPTKGVSLNQDQPKVDQSNTNTLVKQALLENNEPNRGYTPGTGTPVNSGFTSSPTTGKTQNSSPEAPNYGYTNKPGWMGYTSMLGGPIGLAAKAVNAGINAKNTAAVNDQRNMLGFTPASLGQNIKGVISDQKGYIGDLTSKTPTGSTTTPVGFEAEDKIGRTTMTPNEARMREQLTGAQPATEQETKEAIGSFKEAHPEQQGFFSKVAQTTKDFFGNIFGVTPTTTTTVDSSTGQVVNKNSDGSTSGGGYSGNHFPSKPDAPANSSGSPDDRGGDNKGTKNDNPGGYSHPGLY